MTEAILIEISARFRRLEDAIDSLTPDTEMMDGYGDWPAKTVLEALAEPCREDMVSMQECIRRLLEGQAY